jgi:hypothetical protein
MPEHNAEQLDLFSTIKATHAENEILRLTGHKRCSRCVEVLPLDSFSAHKDRWDGLNTVCRKCNAAQVLQWRKENPGKYRKHQRVCANCKKKFRSPSKEARYCSLKCGTEVAAQAAKERHLQVADDKARECARPDCKQAFTYTKGHKGKWCSETCHAIIMERATAGSALRRALENRDYEATLAALKPRVTLKQLPGIPTPCWIWNGRKSSSRKDGSPYPIAKWGRKSVPVHRLVLEAKHGKSLGPQAAHHACANTVCVNPDHLQPVTHRENMAEMLARNSYLAINQELRDALAEFAPDHPLLVGRIEVA